MSDNTLTNHIKIDGDKLAGNCATMSFDVDLTGDGFHSDNEKAPVFRLYAMSPRGRRIEAGGIWSGWYANLGRYPGQDDDSLYAVIPNEYLNTGRQSQN